jgi:hypothetical protein
MQSMIQAKNSNSSIGLEYSSTMETATRYNEDLQKMKMYFIIMELSNNIIKTQ